MVRTAFPRDDTQELLWNPGVHHRYYKIPPLNSILRQFIPSIHSCWWRQRFGLLTQGHQTLSYKHNNICRLEIPLLFCIQEGQGSNPDRREAVLPDVCRVVPLDASFRPDPFLLIVRPGWEVHVRSVLLWHRNVRALLHTLRAALSRLMVS
jgi:hypothetical protein